MSCLYPMVRAETYEKYTCKDGHQAYKEEWLQFDPTEITANYRRFTKWRGQYRKIDIVPCGQCIECRLNRARDWGTRGTLETKYNPENTNWFLTLTYADEYLPTHHTVNTETGELFEGISVNTEDMQKFFKRVRKKWPNVTIKYIDCGEYGGQTMRPHYHAIVFGMPLDITQLKKIGMSKLLQPEWQSPELDKLWPFGHVTIGSATFESISYVCRYTMKKATKDIGDWWYESQGMQKEWKHQSRGIGMEYYNDYRDKIYRTDSVPVVNKKTGKLVKPPRAFDKKYKEYDPEHFEYIKKKRREAGEASELALIGQKSMPIWEQRMQAIEQAFDKYKDLRMEV